MVLDHKEALEKLVDVLQDAHWEVTRGSDEERVEEALSNAIDSLAGNTKIDREIAAMEAALEAKRKERDAARSAS